MNVNQFKKVLGIDLGTTNSVIAVLEGSTPKIITNAEGFPLTPTIVFFTSFGNVIVGQPAKRQNALNPENTFYSIKRFMGAKYDEISHESKKVSYKISQGKNGEIKIKCPILSKDFSPEELSTFVLKKLVYDAERYLKQTISQVILTVPAYFNDYQRLAIKMAGNLAELQVLRIINEPTAAALAHGLNKNKKNEIVLIFDLGGGTFDISILEIGPNIFEVISTDGNKWFGGNDFDQIIVDFIIKNFYSSYKIDLYKEILSLQRIVEAAEKAKIELSTLHSTKINLPFIYIDNQITKSINIDYKRSQFEAQSKNLLQKCKNIVLRALSKANMTKRDIDEIILVGGSTKIPAIKNILIDLFHKPLNEKVNPDEIVAIGAAIQGAVLAGEITDLILLDVTELSLGIETSEGIMTTLIEKNSVIPVRKIGIFHTNYDCVEIHILQGEGPLAKDNKSLGLFQLDGIQQGSKKIPKIKVSFNLDVNGLFFITAKNEQSKIKQQIIINNH